MGSAPADGSESRPYLDAAAVFDETARDTSFVRQRQTPKLPTGARQSSVYFSARPFAFSTGYFFAFAAILASIAAATSSPVMFANSIA